MGISAVPAAHILAFRIFAFDDLAHLAYFLKFLANSVNVELFAKYRDLFSLKNSFSFSGIVVSDFETVFRVEMDDFDRKFRSRAGSEQAFRLNHEVRDIEDDDLAVFVRFGL